MFILQMPLKKSRTSPAFSPKGDLWRLLEEDFLLVVQITMTYEKLSSFLTAYDQTKGI